MKDILDQVINATKATGEFIQQESLQFDRGKVEEKKGFSDLVSYVDKTAETQLVDQLSKILPEAGFIAEEGSGVRKTKLNWIIDPLDGTTNFIHGLPVYSISIALHEDDELILGVVHELNQNECFYATKGEGAYLNGDQIQVSKSDQLNQCLIATGFPYYEFEKIDDYQLILRDLMMSTHGLRRLGSAAVDLAYTACGRFDAYFEFNLNSWDIAAGALLVKEAGGIITNFSGGEDFLFNREIIAAGAVYPELRRVITTRWK